MIEALSRTVRKYAFSRDHGRPLVFVAVIGMAVLFTIGTKGQWTDVDKLSNGFGLSFGFILALYACLYALAYFPYIFVLGMTAYGIGSLFPDPSLPHDVFFAAGGLAMFIIFVKWAGAIRNPRKVVHRNDF